MRLKSRLGKIYYFNYGLLTVDALIEKEGDREDNARTKYLDRAEEGSNFLRYESMTREAKKVYRRRKMLTRSMAIYFPRTWKFAYPRRFFNFPPQYEWAYVGKRATYQKAEYRFNFNYRGLKQTKAAKLKRPDHERSSTRSPRKRKRYRPIKSPVQNPVLVI